jgi:mevalonate kinase
MGSGKGFGKVILLNEHFVVYGIPAIVSAIGSSTTAVVGPYSGEGWTLDDERKETPGYKKEKAEHQRESVVRILKSAGIDTGRNPIHILLEGDLIAASGVGASAASCAAIARALSDYFTLGLSDERINELAYEGEKAYHGSPSGVDNTAATYGGLIWFIRGDPIVIERLRLKNPVEIVMGNTGIVANTKAAVEGVRARKEKEPEKYDNIFKEARELAGKTRDAIEMNEINAVGHFMNRGHELLQSIEVSCPELDRLVEVARSNGALGAKLTGGGLGGYMVALTPGKELQEKVAIAIENEGFFALRTLIGV